MNRLLCIDFGSKRMGVALSDPLGLTAQPYPFIPHDKAVITNIKNLIHEYNVTKIILGLPKSRDGGDSKKAVEVRAFGDRLQQETGLPLDYWDERYSTKASERHLIAAGVRRNKRKQVIDSQAAVFILQGYLDSLRVYPRSPDLESKDYFC